MKDEQTKKRILEIAEVQFVGLGFKKVTMDEIAAELGMSKKTLYLYFESKIQLLEAVVDFSIEKNSFAIHEVVFDENLSFLEKLKNLIKLVTEIHSKIQPKAILDIKKNAPEIWEKINVWRECNIKNDFSYLIAEGVKKGYFREDIPQEIIVMLYSSLIQTMIQPELLNQINYTPAQAYNYLMEVVYVGIFTQDARVQNILEGIKQ